MPPGRRNCGNRNTRPTTDLAPWTLTLHPLPALPRTRAMLANNSQEVLLPTTLRPRIRPRLSPLPPSTNTNRAMDIPTLLRHNIPHSPKLAPTGTPRFLRLPCPRPMVRTPVPLSTGETTKPPGVIPLPDRTGCLKPCLMYLPPPQDLQCPHSRHSCLWDRVRPIRRLPTASESYPPGLPNRCSLRPRCVHYYSNNQTCRGFV
jgi:hypothetical protein